MAKILDQRSFEKAARETGGSHCGPDYRGSLQGDVSIPWR